MTMLACMRPQHMHVMQLAESIRHSNCTCMHACLAPPAKSSSTQWIHACLPAFMHGIFLYCCRASASSPVKSLLTQAISTQRPQESLKPSSVSGHAAYISGMLLLYLQLPCNQANKVHTGNERSPNTERGEVACMHAGKQSCMLRSRPYCTCSCRACSYMAPLHPCLVVVIIEGCTSVCPIICPSRLSDEGDDAQGGDSSSGSHGERCACTHGDAEMQMVELMPCVDAEDALLTGWTVVH